MGSGAANQRHPHAVSIYMIDNNKKLLAFSIKFYDQSGTVTDHSEVEALVQDKDGYFVLRLSFAVNGLTVHPLSSPRSTPYIESRSKHYEVRKYNQKDAYRNLIRVAKKFNYKSYSTLFTHCQHFTQQVQKDLRWMCDQKFSDVWHLYDLL